MLLGRTRGGKRNRRDVCSDALANCDTACATTRSQYEDKMPSIPAAQQDMYKKAIADCVPNCKQTIELMKSQGKCDGATTKDDGTKSDHSVEIKDMVEEGGAGGTTGDACKGRHHLFTLTLFLCLVGIGALGPGSGAPALCPTCGLTVLNLCDHDASRCVRLGGRVCLADPCMHASHVRQSA